MSHRAVTALQRILRPHVGLSKSRLETLCLLVIGMVSARTVNLGHIACERSGASVLIASTYRRLQRFFQHVRPAATGRCRWWRNCSGCRDRGISRSTARSGASASAR